MNQIPFYILLAVFAGMLLRQAVLYRRESRLPALGGAGAGPSACSPSPEFCTMLERLASYAPGSPSNIPPHPTWLHKPLEI